MPSLRSHRTRHWRLVPLAAFATLACQPEPSGGDGGVPPDAAMDAARADDAGSSDAALSPGDAGPGPDMGAGPIVEASVLFYDDFESYSEMRLEGGCRSLGAPRCSEATFPWREAGATPGYDFFLAPDGIYNDEHGSAYITTRAGRGGRGRGLEAWDEEESPAKGPSQWGTELQLARYFEGTEYPELWVDFHIRWNPDVIEPTHQQKILHLFHYRADWLAGGGGFFNTNRDGEQTDGGIICRFDTHGGPSYEMDILCATRCANSYKCRNSPIAGTGTQTASPEGSDWSRRGIRFPLRGSSSCGLLEDDAAWSALAGSWHEVELGVVYNSAPGVLDGSLTVYFDGCLLGVVRGVGWMDEGTSPVRTGWTGATFGGNANHIGWGESGDEQHTYAIDDVRICTERCP
jgi:hypothetical protein